MFEYRTDIVTALQRSELIDSEQFGNICTTLSDKEFTFKSLETLNSEGCCLMLNKNDLYRHCDSFHIHILKGNDVPIAEWMGKIWSPKIVVYRVKAKANKNKYSILTGDADRILFLYQKFLKTKRFSISANFKLTIVDLRTWVEVKSIEINDLHSYFDVVPYKQDDPNKGLGSGSLDDFVLLDLEYRVPNEEKKILAKL